MITVLIPAAGNGQRFIDAGYEVPKALINVCGKPMLKRVIDNVTPSREHRVVVVSRMDSTDVWPLLGKYDIHVRLNTPTEGAIDTILRGGHYASDEPLLVANCDQLARFSVDDFIDSARGGDGAILTFKSSTPHHSYVTVGHTGSVTAIKEKEVISSQAVTGVYLFNRGLDFIRACEQVIERNERSVNNEYYVSSAIARMVADGKRLVTYDAQTAILGTPSELQLFEMAVEVGREL